MSFMSIINWIAMGFFIGLGFRAVSTLYSLIIKK